MNYPNSPPQGPNTPYTPSSSHPTPPQPPHITPYTPHLPLNPPQQPLPPPPGYSIIACLVLSRTDRLRFMGFPKGVLGEVRETLKRFWMRGVQGEGEYEGVCWEFKLGGRPWSETGTESLYAHRLIAKILYTLSLNGWHFYRACDLSKKGVDKDTIFFKHTGPRERRFFSISFRKQDRLCIVDAPDEAVTRAFRMAVRSWAPGIQDESSPIPSSLEFKLRGNPWWTSHGIEVLQARALCCRLLAEMEGIGYSLVGSVDMCGTMNGNHQSPDLDTWFFGTT